MDTPIQPFTLTEKMKAHIGRFTDKSFDWNAFPGNVGFPELARAQMRYIGAGGSPKVNDESTLKSDRFTLSLVYKEPGKYAACHSHEVEESFLVINGALIVGWEQDGEVVEVNLGPKDMILNARDVGHGFRIDGVEPVLMSISVDSGQPLPPVYLYHPKTHPAACARNFGAQPGKTMVFNPKDPHPLQQLMSRYVVRHSELETIWEEAGFNRKVYVGEGGVKQGTCRKEMLGIPSRISVKPFVRDVEEAYLVLEGALTVGWTENGKEAIFELGPRDLIKIPAAQSHWFGNNGAAHATVWRVIGSPMPDRVSFKKA